MLLVLVVVVGYCCSVVIVVGYCCSLLLLLVTVIVVIVVGYCCSFLLVTYDSFLFVGLLAVSSPTAGHHCCLW